MSFSRDGITPGGVPPRTAMCLIPDESALAPLARRLVAALPARAFVALDGDLGAGKTTFVKALAAAVGIDEAEVVSPTFGLIHVHPVPPRAGGPTSVVHADLYRLADASDLEEIGWEDATAGPCWIFVEWPQRIATALPADRLDIAIQIDSETGRTFRFTPRGDFVLTGFE